MEETDYESLPENSPVFAHMIAGATAGILEHSVMYPVDCVKTRMQCLVPDPNANYRNIVDAFYRIVRYEGIRRTVRGISVVVSGAGPAHALYFACYEKLKSTLKAAAPQKFHNIVPGIAGGCATMLHDAVMNPVDVVKQRMQIYNSPYRTCRDCGRTVIAKEGFRAFYHSYTTQLMMNIPFQSIHFMTYELMQDLLNSDREYRPTTHVVSGAVAGAMAAAITTPLDVCKTLLNTQERCALARQKHAINGFTEAFRTVYAFQGVGGYFRGMSARVLFQMPATAISWFVYESFKHVLLDSQGNVRVAAAHIST